MKSLRLEVVEAMTRLQEVEHKFDSRIEGAFKCEACHCFSQTLLLIHFTAELAGNRLHMEQLLSRLAGSDQTLDRRLLALEAQLQQQLAELDASQQDAVGAWFLPFFSLAVAIVIIGAWGCSHFIRIRKLHSL